MIIWTGEAYKCGHKLDGCQCEAINKKVCCGYCEKCQECEDVCRKF